MHAPEHDPAAGAPAVDVPGAWHPDPLRRYELRYFNGRAWTADVAVDGQRFVDPVPLDAPVPARDPSAGVPRARTGVATAALVVAISSAAVAWVPFLVVLGAAGAFVALGLGIAGLRASRRHGGAGRRASVIALWLVPVALVLSVAGVILTVIVVDDLQDSFDAGEHVITTQPCTTADGIVTFTGTIRNDTAKRRDYVITIDVRDADRRLLSTDEVEVEQVAPGEEAAWSARRRVPDTTVTCEVADVRGPGPFGLDG